MRKPFDFSQNSFTTDLRSTCSEDSVVKIGQSKFTREAKALMNKNTMFVAIDCEMVGVGAEKTSALARCSIVNYDGNVIYDSYVKPEEKISDYRTKWSGIRPSDMKKAIPFRKARKQARKLLKGRVLIGHSIQSDLSVLQLKHPFQNIRDTSKFIPLREMAGLSTQATPSLKNLAKNILETEIQSNEHCSVEDARACLSLYKHCEKKWEKQWNEMKESSYLCDAYWPSWTNTK